MINKAKEGEKILKYYGFSDCRFRIHNDIARIEIPLCEINKFIGLREKILIKLKSLNLKYYTLDIEGLRIASMDCALSRKIMLYKQIAICTVTLCYIFSDSRNFNAVKQFLLFNAHNIHTHLTSDEFYSL